MKLGKKILAFYINSSIHVALAVCALMAITTLEFSLSLPLEFWAFIFFGTITGYNFVKYAEVAGLHHRSLANSLKTIQVFSFISFGVLVYCCFLLSIETLLVTGILGLLTFLYAVPLLFRKNLRTLGGIKIFVVAVVWAGVSVVLPTIAAETNMTTDSWLTFAQKFFFVLVITLPFEIRDLPYDAAALKTLPQRLGIKKAKALGISFLCITIVLEGFKTVIANTHFLSLILICFLAGAVLLMSKKKQSTYFASLWVESIPIVWFLTMLLFRQFLT